VADGFIVCVNASGHARIVADGLGYTNEVALHPNGRWLYVNETFGRRLSRFLVKEDGSLGARETVTEFGVGDFPDGLAFDEDGCAWIVSIVSNRLIRVWPDGRQEIYLEDNDPGHLDWVEEAFQAHTMGRPPHQGGTRRRAGSGKC
jgi:sugar lactone lactonase YvrE